MQEKIKIEVSMEEFGMIINLRGKERKRKQYLTAKPKNKEWHKCKWHNCDMDGVHCSKGYGSDYNGCWVDRGNDCENYEEGEL